MIHVLLTEKENSRGYYLQNIVKRSKRLNVVSVTQNSIEILYALIQQRVDLMIIDNGLIGLSARDCCGMVQKLNIPVKIILLVDSKEEYDSVCDSDCFVGYLLRKSTPDEVLEKISKVLDEKLSGFKQTDKSNKKEVVYSES